MDDHPSRNGYRSLIVALLHPWGERRLDVFVRNLALWLVEESCRRSFRTDRLSDLKQVFDRAGLAVLVRRSFVHHLSIDHTVQSIREAVDELGRLFDEQDRPVGDSR